MSKIPSIAMIPSGYKAGKLYSVLPTDGAGDFTTTRNTVATRVNENGLIEEVAANVPRLDYSDGGCPSLLLEPQRTNAIEYSEDFTQWASTNVTVNSNVANSPNGNLTADRITFDGTTNARVETSAQGISVFDGTKSRPNSVWLKTESGTTTVQIGSSSSSLITATVTEEWQRFTHNSRQGFPRIKSDNATSVLAWGYQFETNGDVGLGYATSYIPTQGTTQTRVADTASGAGNSTVINSSEGVLYAEISALGDDVSRLISISDGSTSNQVHFEYSVITNLIRIRLISDGDEQSFYQSTSYDYLQYHKIAISYKLNNFKIYIDGTEVYTDTPSIMPIGLNELSFSNGTNGGPFYGKTKDLRVYTTVLSDAELAILTTI